MHREDFSMSSLRLGLAALGILVLVSIVVYSLWLTRRSGPSRQEALIRAEDSQIKEEPVLDDSATGPDTLPILPIPVPDRRAVLDALIDVLVPIALEAPVLGEAVLSALPPTRRVGSKPFSIEGLALESQRWESLLPGERYSALQAGVQLANRAGALNDIEFSEFVIQTQRVCDAVGGTPDFPDMRSEVARARELDQFAGDHDAQIGFVLRARRAAWNVGYVQQMAARQGFVTGQIAGRMVLPAREPGLTPVLTLGFDAVSEEFSEAALRELTLTLDVPLVDRQETAFARMCESAQAMARDMDGILTDDNGVALPASAMEVIARELDQLYDVLEQREFAAGSSLARRLFS